MEILEANEETHGSIRQKINGNFAETVSQNMIGQPNGVAGLDPDGNIVASVVPLGNTWLALKDVVLAAGERAYCVDTTENFTGDGTSAIRDMWASSCDKYEVDRGSNGAAEFERVQREHGLPIVADEAESYSDLVGGVRMIISNDGSVKNQNYIDNVPSASGFIKMSLYNGSSGTAQVSGGINIEDAVGLVAPYGPTEILVVACDAAGVAVDVGAADGVASHDDDVPFGDVNVLAYMIMDNRSVYNVYSVRSGAQRRYPNVLTGYEIVNDSSPLLDLRHLTPEPAAYREIRVFNCGANAVWLGDAWVSPATVWIGNCPHLTEVRVLGEGPSSLLLYGTGLGVDAIYDMIDGLLGSSTRSVYIAYGPFATAHNGSGTQIGQTHTVAEVIALAVAKNITIDVS